MLKLLYSALMILLTSSLMANSHPEPGKFSLTGEFLFMRPSFDDTYFVVRSPDGVLTQTFPQGEKLQNDFHFNSGFRIAFDYALCDCVRSLSVDYVWLKCGKHLIVNNNVGVNTLSATVGIPAFDADFTNFNGSANSHNHTFYQRIDPLFCQSLYECCGLKIRALAGLEYAYLYLHEDYDYAVDLLGGNIGSVEKNSRTWGIGPQLGFDFEYELCNGEGCCCLPGILTFNLCTTGSILTGKTGFEQSASGVIATVPTTFLDVSDERSWRILPAFHTRFGFNYATKLFNYWCADIAVGYEFSSYIRGLARETFSSSTSDFAHSEYYNYDLQGVYVTLSVNF